MKPWILVSPASRGIGLAAARHILGSTKAPVVATARGNLKEAREAIVEGVDESQRKSMDEKRLEVLRVDVTDEDSIRHAAEHCKARFPQPEHHLHLAFTCPGILLHPEKSPAEIDEAAALKTLATNTLGPMLLIKHFHAFLPDKRTKLPKSEEAESKSSAGDEYRGLDPRTATWATLSARVGSISDNRLGGWFAYRASKAAVNQVIRTFDNHLQQRSGSRAQALAFHPGTVRTDLSKEYWGRVKEEILREPEWVAERLVGLCTVGSEEGLKPIRIEGRGRCWDYNGDEVPP